MHCYDDIYDHKTYKMGESKNELPKLSNYGPHLFDLRLSAPDKLYNVLAFETQYDGFRETMRFFVECTDGTAKWYTREEFDGLGLQGPEDVTFERFNAGRWYGILFAKGVTFKIVDTLVTVHVNDISNDCRLERNVCLNVFVDPISGHEFWLRIVIYGNFMNMYGTVRNRRAEY